MDQLKRYALIYAYKFLLNQLLNILQRLLFHFTTPYFLYKLVRRPLNLVLYYKHFTANTPTMKRDAKKIQNFSDIAAIGPAAVNIELKINVYPTSLRPPIHSANIP